MNRFLRSLMGCSRREMAAEETARRQSEDHAIAMQVADLRVDAAKAAAAATVKTSERAAQIMLRHLKEDMPHGMD